MKQITYAIIMCIFFSGKMGFDIFVGDAVLNFSVDAQTLLPGQMTHYQIIVVRCIELKQVKGEWGQAYSCLPV